MELYLWLMKKTAPSFVCTLWWLWSVMKHMRSWSCLKHAQLGTKVIRTDNLASSSYLEKHLLALHLGGLCNFHIRKINFREQVKNHPFCEEILQTFRSWLQKAQVSTHEWDEVNFPKFCAKWPGIAAEYATTLYPSRTQWAALAWAPVFLAGKTGNTPAEQGMHA